MSRKTIYELFVYVIAKTTIRCSFHGQHFPGWRSWKRQPWRVTCGSFINVYLTTGFGLVPLRFCCEDKSIKCTVKCNMKQCLHVDESWNSTKNFKIFATKPFGFRHLVFPHEKTCKLFCLRFESKGKSLCFYTRRAGNFSHLITLLSLLSFVKFSVVDLKNSDWGWGVYGDFSTSPFFKLSLLIKQTLLDPF